VLLVVLPAICISRCLWPNALNVGHKSSFKSSIFPTSRSTYLVGEVATPTHTTQEAAGLHSNTTTNFHRTMLCCLQDCLGLPWISISFDLNYPPTAPSRGCLGSRDIHSSTDTSRKRTVLQDWIRHRIHRECLSVLGELLVGGSGFSLAENLGLERNKRILAYWGNVADRL